MSIPLSEEDIAILALESAAVAGHTMKVIRVAAPGIGVNELKASLAGRIDEAPELTRRLGGEPGLPAWVTHEDFDLDNHVASHGDAGDEPVDEDGLRRATASLFAERLDRDLPLWRIDVVPLAGGGTALIWRIHHVMADGTTAMRLAGEVLWDEAATRADTAGANTKAVTHAERQVDHERRRRHLIGLFERELTRSKGGSPFDGAIGTGRVVAFATLSLSGLHDAAKSLAGATLNDAVLAVVAGALRRWMDLHDEVRVDSLRVKVPVSLHHDGDTDGNHDSFFSVPLPLGEPDPLARLKEIRAATVERKSDHDAEELDTLLRRVSHASERLGRLLRKVEASPRRFALNVSNVKGPRSAVTLGGSEVESVHSVVEIGEHHALRVAVLSVGDRLCFGFCADPELVEDLDEMAAGAEAAADELQSLG